MKILSVRKGFLADHSSTSYEFLAIDKPLDAKARAKVSSLSSRVRPTTRRAHFIYHGEWSDIPGGWEPLMEKYYDVMYSESYDWWTFATAFNATDKKLIAKLGEYEFEGENDLGVRVNARGKRVMVTLHCVLDAASMYNHSNEWYDYCVEDEEDLQGKSGLVAATNDSLLNLLSKIRGCLMRGQFEPLYAMWQQYGDDKEGAPPKPKKTKNGTAVASALADILMSI